jgi:hypothetical protein
MKLTIIMIQESSWTFAFHCTIALCECVKLKFGKGFLLGGVPLLPKNTFIGKFSPVIPNEVKNFQYLSFDCYIYYQFLTLDFQ